MPADRGKPGRLLPHGAGPVAAGLVVSGAAAYAFLAITARLLGPARYAPLAAFWSLTFLVGPGCFGILEKDTGRRLAAGAALGVRDGPVVRRTATFGAILCAALVIVAAATAPWSTSRLFDGDGWLLVAFSLSLPSMCGEHLAWGTLAGNGRFRAYGMVNAAEALVRLLGCAALAGLGAWSAAPFAFVVALAPLVAVLIVRRALRTSSGRGPSLTLRDVSRSLSWLLVSSFLSSVLINAGPIAVSLLAGPADRANTGRFLTGLVLVRVPLFLYTSASATLLPALAGHAAADNRRAFGTTLMRLAGAAVGLGLVAVAAAATIGPAILRLVFGPRFALPALDLTLLAASAAALLLATTLSVAMTAAGSLVQLAAAWAAGVVAMILTIAALHPLLRRVELGLLLGATASVLAMALSLIRSTTGIETDRARTIGQPGRGDTHLPADKTVARQTGGAEAVTADGTWATP